MAEPKKQVPLRLNAKLYDALAAWAEDDFRSVNGQIEYLLTECVRQRKKMGNMSPTSWMSRRSWISIEEPVKKRLERAAEHAKRKLFTRPLHKTGAAALCLSGKSRAFRREAGTNER